MTGLRGTVTTLLLAATGGLIGCMDQMGGRASSPATQPAKLAAVIAAAPSRSFAMCYQATVRQVPSNAKRLDLWVPAPASDAQQTISNLRVESAQAHSIQTEGEYGNRVVHVWSDEPAPLTATISFECVRRAEVALPAGAEQNVSSEPLPTHRLVEPDRLGVIDDHVRALASEITAGRSGTLAKSRAIYDYVLAHMAYDKAAPGWGHGDTQRACEVGKGNCTDFHALFISLARASGIPARFQIGFQLPVGRQTGQIAGYHCWAEFWLPGTGWVPVDASEGWKNPSRRDFYFGGLDEDRVAMSDGRDLTLPGMKGRPLNYLLSPYSEVDGRPVAAEKSVSFGPPGMAVARK